MSGAAREQVLRSQQMHGQVPVLKRPKPTHAKIFTTHSAFPAGNLPRLQPGGMLRSQMLVARILALQFRLRLRGSAVETTTPSNLERLAIDGNVTGLESILATLQEALGTSPIGIGGGIGGGGTSSVSLSLVAPDGSTGTAETYATGDEMKAVVTVPTGSGPTSIRTYFNGAQAGSTLQWSEATQGDAYTIDFGAAPSNSSVTQIYVVVGFSNGTSVQSNTVSLTTSGSSSSSPSITLKVSGPDSSGFYTFDMSGPASGDKVALLVNTEGDTGGSCQNWNGSGCVGGASIWDQATLGSPRSDGSGGYIMQESFGAASANGLPTGTLYFAIYDQTTRVTSNWVAVTVNPSSTSHAMRTHARARGRSG